MAALALRIKTKTGQSALNGMTSEDSVFLLKNRISELTSLDENGFNLLRGFPPRPIDMSDDCATLADVGITSGDTLITDEKKAPPVPATVPTIPDCPQVPASRREHTETDMFNTAPGMLLRKVVPSDNSCLFTSINYCISGEIDKDCPTFMREVISSTVSGDPETFNAGMLGKPNKDYCKWIKKSDTWGGAIEIAILTDYYGMEIDVVDTQHSVISRFGENKSYGQRILLIYDGIHYDPLYLEPFNAGPIQTMFSTDNPTILAQAEEVAKEAQVSKQYTDLNNFTLKCLVCQKLLTGQTQATHHAKDTGHTNFGEVS